MSGDDEMTNLNPWLRRDLPVARTLDGPIRDYLRLEAAGGIALLVATVAALVVANTALAGTVEDFWQTELTLIDIGDFHLSEPLHAWVNDGLMTIFFFVVGLEIKRELVVGELSEPRVALLPVVAAVGGMVVPAVLYAIINGTGDAGAGWGIPMATDIAFAVGLLALLGPRIPSPLRLFLLTLAIVDDIGAIVVIGLFYTDQLHLDWAMAAFALIAVTVALKALRVWAIPIYVALGAALWVATFESGVHATIAGVIMGLLAPARALRPEPHHSAIDADTTVDTIHKTIFEVRESAPVAERLQHLIHPWSAFLVLPMFAFANARIDLSGSAIQTALQSRTGLGIVAGLVIGKPLGILAATWLAQRSGAAALPEGVTFTHIAGIGAVAGIGFTVSLFITDLAFTNPLTIVDAHLGIVVASLLAAAAGTAVLWYAPSKPGPEAKP